MFVFIVCTSEQPLRKTNIFCNRAKQGKNKTLQRQKNEIQDKKQTGKTPQRHKNEIQDIKQTESRRKKQKQETKNHTYRDKTTLLTMKAGSNFNQGRAIVGQHDLLGVKQNVYCKT